MKVVKAVKQFFITTLKLLVIYSVVMMAVHAFFGEWFDLLEKAATIVMSMYLIEVIEKGDNMIVNFFVREFKKLKKDPS